MNVLQISPYDHQGGASRIAWNLFEGYKKRGIDSYLAVGKKSLDDPHILEIDNSNYHQIKILTKARKWLEIMLGMEYFNYPGTQNISKLLPTGPDVIHAHNLHGKYFDLRVLPDIAMQFPTILTLHDTWMFSGHCAYAIDCDRWKTGCGKCPDLTIPPQVRRDSTSFNWNRKKGIYAQCRLNIATPSKWIMNQMEQSILLPGVVRAKVIHNGVDLSVFKLGDKQKVRKQLGLPDDAFILLFVVAAALKENKLKDYETIHKALSQLKNRIPGGRKVIFLGLGEQGETEIDGDMEKRFIPYQKDASEVVKYYQAADVYLHAARADTFPNVILEALACGTPVIATDVGGISEQIIDGRTGSLVPAKGYELMSSKIIELLNDVEMNKRMSFEATADAGRRFSLNRMVDEYINFYHEIISDFVSVGNNDLA